MTAVGFDVELLASLPAGIELDTAVAEFVFNRIIIRVDGRPPVLSATLQPADPVSRDISLAWLVHKHMGDQIFSKREQYLKYLHYEVSMRMVNHDHMHHDYTALFMEAIDICRAAIRAIGGGD